MQMMIKDTIGKVMFTSSQLLEWLLRSPNNKDTAVEAQLSGLAIQNPNEERRMQETSEIGI